MSDVAILNTSSNLSAKTLMAAENAETITGLKTFDRDPSAPFAVSASSAVVTNLDADKLDGEEGSAYHNAANLTGTPASAVQDNITRTGVVASGTWNSSIKPRVQTVASAATVTAASDTEDLVVVTAQAAGITLANPTGSPNQGQKLIYRIKDNGTARAISYGANFRAVGVTAPTTTVISKTLYLGCVYNSTDSKWDILAVALEA